MIPLNYHHLYYFFVVAKEGSIAKARAKLFLSQPTISAQLKELEAQLGRPLFERRKQRLHLTDEGRVVLDYAERIFDLGAELHDVMADRPPQARQRAQIGIIAGYPAAIYESLSAFLFSQFPDAHLSFRMKEAAALAEDLRDHRLDLVLSESPLEEGEGERFTSRLAAKIPVMLAAAPRVARRLRALPRGLDAAPVVVPGPPWGLRHQLTQAFDRWKVRPDIIGETQDLELAWRLGIAGRGVVPVDQRTLTALKGAMVPLRFPSTPSLHLPVYLTARQKRWLNPLAERALARFRCQPGPR
jgi:LysR family transcriptional activator of nhaA